MPHAVVSLPTRTDYDAFGVARVAYHEPLRTRLAYVHALRPFNLEDARNYVRFHLRHAGADERLFTDTAVTGLFHAAGGVPRVINQLALQVLIDAVVRGIDSVDADAVKRTLHGHPLYTHRGKAA